MTRTAFNKINQTEKNISRSHRLVAFLRCFFVCVMVMLVVSVPNWAQAAESTTTVKVGYAKLPGFLYETDEGYAGFAYELLEEVAKYNHWTYTFTEVPYSDAQTMLESGKIDMYIPYQKTPQRAEVYEYGNTVFCTNNASLLTRPDSPIGFGDYAKMNNLTIGAVQGTRNGDRFIQHLEANGCTNNTIKNDYKSIEDMNEDMDSGVLDAFVSASSRGISSYKMIDQLEETNSYAIAKKGDRHILDALDAALSRIDASQQNFRSELELAYRLPESGAYPTITSDEYTYIQKKKNVSVLVSAQECDSSGQFSGSAKTIMEEMTKLTGLTFTPVVVEDSSQIFNAFKSGKADILYSFTHDYEWAQENNAWLTENYASFYNQVVTHQGNNISDIKKVATVSDTYINFYLGKTSKYELVTYDSYKDCLDAVKKHEVDAMYCNSLIGGYYATMPKYRGLKFMTAYDFKSGYCMAVAQSQDPILVDILNKGMECIPEKVMNQSFEKQSSSYKMNLFDFYYANPAIMIGIICFIVLVVIGLLFAMVYIHSIHKKNAQLEEAGRAKTDFMSRMSHDMRTPMNGILGLARLSRDEKDPEIIQENLATIERSGDYLLALINDVLDMNRIDSGKLELSIKPMDSQKVFGDIMTTAMTQAKEKGVNLDIQVPEISDGEWVEVMADASRLEQVMVNIISNAIKFTPKGGTVTLNMQTIAINNDMVCDRYIVSDTGIGMSEEFLPHLFESFAQEGRANTKRDEGTGLGMPIVKELVDLMGGTITVESTINVGTTITINLQYPVAPKRDKTQSNIPQNVDLTVLEGCRVLVCEDHPVNMQITRKLLEKKGVVVDEADDGQKGVDRFMEAPVGTYDAILMDIRMPVMNGMEATTAIRQVEKDREDETTAIPIIALTANAFTEDIKRCQDVGMNEHVSKPVNPVQLYTTLSRLIGKTKASQKQDKE